MSVNKSHALGTCITNFLGISIIISSSSILACCTLSRFMFIMSHFIAANHDGKSQFHFLVCESVVDSYGRIRLRYGFSHGLELQFMVRFGLVIWHGKPAIVS